MPRYLKRGMDASAIKAADAKVRETVESILAQVEEKKDTAIRELSEKFDKWSPASFRLSASEIERLIKAAIPDAEVTIVDLAGDGDHYSARVVSRSFAGVPRIRQHQKVYAALGGRMGQELHALQLQTAAPEDMERG